MATLVLGAVGSAIGGAFGGTILGFSGAAIGGFIGSTIGSAVDSWIVSSLAPAQRIEGARLDSLRIAVVTRMGWIKRQQAKFDFQPRQTERTYVSGESHFFFGQRYRLNMIEGAPAGRVHIRNSRMLDLYVRSGSDQPTRERVFQDWYRRELRTRAVPLIETWAEAFGIDVPKWGIKRMKTKWGTCNIEAKRIWLNLELVKKPPQCLEYVIVHELAHFFERNHSDRFVALLDQKLPQWRLIRDELNAAPLAHEEWSE